MRKLTSLVLLLTATVLTGCGGSDNTLFNPNPGTPGTTPPPDIATLTLLTSAAAIASDGSETATITALVRDTNNNVVEGVAVVFSSDSGSLAVTQPAITDANGQLTATLSTAGDATARTITVTGTASDITATVPVAVSPISLEVTCPNLALGDNGNCTVTVLGKTGGSPLDGVTVDLSSGNGNTLTPSQVVSGSAAAGTGRATFNFEATTGGSDTVTATALGASAATTVNVSNDTFTFCVPDGLGGCAAVNPGDPAVEISLGPPGGDVTVNWVSGGAGQNGPITFATTRGTINGNVSSTATVNAAGGLATVTVQSTNAGPAIVTANNGTDTTQVAIEFVATTPSTIDVQASPFTVSPSEQSTITAKVRDPAGNLVKNAVVVFQLDDITGGSLSAAQAPTNSQGEARVIYTSSTTTSASNGVTITAFVQGAPAVSDSVRLTVASRELFISIGTGNEIFEPNSATYRVEYAVQVTDSQGNGVEGVTVQVSILSERYFKGYWAFPLGGDAWVRFQTAACDDEDPDRDGILDGAEDGLVLCDGILQPAEDLNGNGILDFGDDFNQSCLIEAGNVATASPQGGTGGGNFVTDAAGFGLVDVIYPQEYATWVEVVLEAKTAVQGTEFAEPNRFLLPVAASDVDDENETPPARIRNFVPESPFGSSANCGDTL